MGKRIAIIGGGPAGLYFAVLAKKLDPSHDITIWERNARDDTFGFGVVFSDETLSGIENADPEVYAAMQSCFAQWNEIDVHFKGERITIGGQGFAATSRKELLLLLQERALALGVTIHFRTEAPDVDELSRDYDLVVACDGINSRVRPHYADSFKPTLDPRQSKFIWLGLDRAIEAFTFHVKHTPWGIMQVHAYPYSATESTFLVEMHEDVWRSAGFDASESTSFPPGVSDDESVAKLGAIFAEELDGATLLTNNSKWITFNTVRNEQWRHENVVLLGDAAHTAHFSIGSGTKLALEDALALAANVHEFPEDLPAALEAYEEERRPVVLSLQRAAQASLEWFENIGQYADQDPLQFAFNLLTRSRRITFENLGLRDAEFADIMQRDFAQRVSGADIPAMFQPAQIGKLELKNRIIVSAMNQYSAEDGLVGDFHLVHIGSRATGGAGLIMSEMIAPSADGRISPGCPGLYTDEQRNAWARIVDYVHANSTAKIGAQIGHSGRKGSTKKMWEGIDDPVEAGGWEVIAPSAIPYGPGCNVPREATSADLDRVRSEYTAAARRADEAGFDLIELHAAHGYLLSSFLSPIANQRTDSYGGSLENRLRYPLEVFDAVRAVWPEEKPLLVRISAHDWVPGGNTDEEAVAIAAAFIEHGADGIDVSSGQVSKTEKPQFGRSYQTPFADKIRNRVAEKAGVPVIAVGAISSYDDVNSLLLAGRCDFVAIGRSHLYDPHWTLHAAADQEYRGEAADWIDPYRAGRRKPPVARTDAVRPRLELLTGATPADGVHTRWIGGQTIPVS
ncbi:bifunctional salicylyl-CoA 5-hydroxylase/oxidoreductase [Leucobacter luti]|uniref:Anthraniloyl-CoA monooxygenase n=1 Tax=Leucobacter luti TaxID=340320 RepID=A0A4R6S710_9MICO|nr:bifunctional salicylyl-CoA 5-hydroxylase/oxidoreductase [Leucobacter luti]MCW2288681.1 anthraniloyl-CoA monooxygenase [Leucobacter luti]QYM75397.1 bifunctional salicylyl-CoA 5-hydroxylase/oxidoreductase [Leucobacter luti]TCK45164.1 anthraniloyl-CoA monooxygenase [Leucobacter luti]TDP95689.1 anthraniloyl-CoA monooxygenase [Leucobacter luti]